MFSVKQFRGMIVDVLKYLEPEIPYSDTAVELLMLTAAHESKLGTYLKQVRGPARGAFQMEPFTHDDLWKTRPLANNSDLRSKVSLLRNASPDPKLDDMRGNLYYQIAMARVFYRRIKAPLPRLETEEMAKYWKKYYNTHLGKGTVERAVRDYEEYVLGR